MDGAKTRENGQAAPDAATAMEIGERY